MIDNIPSNIKELCYVHIYEKEKKKKVNIDIHICKMWYVLEIKEK